MVSFIAINNFFIMPHSFALINNHIEHFKMMKRPKDFQIRRLLGVCLFICKYKFKKCEISILKSQKDETCHPYNAKV
jgi:hypothetical protein